MNLTEISTAEREASSPGFFQQARGPMGLLFCFSGIMVSFVSHNILMERATSGSEDLHEMSFLFFSSTISVVVALVCRCVRKEVGVRLSWGSFATLGLASIGSSFFSVRALRYVIFPVKVLAKSCKPVPVMLIGNCMGKRYPLRKYVHVFFIVSGVALFLGGGTNNKKTNTNGGDSNEDVVTTGVYLQIIGVAMLTISLCFDGGLSAYEDKLVTTLSLTTFDLMYNIHLANAMICGASLVFLNELSMVADLIHGRGLQLLAIGLLGALGQVFVFATIAWYGALTCSIMGLARKLTTICASIYIYQHPMYMNQKLGLAVTILAMLGGPAHERSLANKVQHQNVESNEDPNKEEKRMYYLLKKEILKRAILFLALFLLAISFFLIEHYKPSKYHVMEQQLRQAKNGDNWPKS